MSSRPPSTEQRGFTILECMVAAMVLVLMAYGWMRLHSSHADLIASMDQDFEQDPVLYVDRAEGEFERVVGISARATTDPPTPPNGSGTDDFTVTVLLVERDLEPPTASARAYMEENE